LADHLLEILSVAPRGAFEVSGLTRVSYLDALITRCPGLGWPATHAAVRSLATGSPVLTTAPGRYAGAGLNVLSL